ncbi:NAD-dependent epimerase/dehydratase family protein, partial [Clostridium perfringens]|nr:NAD-dependent epimerase/dehydratase family protein [Clostridium perfringens]
MSSVISSLQAADLNNLSEVAHPARDSFLQGNITDRLIVEQIFEEYQPEAVIHFAAESHVDNSIASPGQFIETNINGTFVLLDVARHYWMNGPFEFKERYMNCRFHHIST